MNKTGKKLKSRWGLCEIEDAVRASMPYRHTPSSVIHASAGSLSLRSAGLGTGRTWLRTRVCLPNRPNPADGGQVTLVQALSIDEAIAFLAVCDDGDLLDVIKPAQKLNLVAT